MDVPSKHVWRIKESCYVYTTIHPFCLDPNFSVATQLDVMALVDSLMISHYNFNFLFPQASVAIANIQAPLTALKNHSLSLHKFIQSELNSELLGLACTPKTSNNPYMQLLPLHYIIIIIKYLYSAYTFQC